MSDSKKRAHEQVEHLTDAVHSLADQVEGLRNVLDELRSQLVLAIRNGRLSDPSSSWLVRLKSMPADPTGDWSNRVGVESIEVPTSVRNADQPHFCCTNPQLGWFGDPGFPSIECANCGYLVADDGQLVLYSAPDQNDEKLDAHVDDVAKKRDDSQRSFPWDQETADG